MTSQTRATLKGYFNTNDQPTEAQFEDLIDSAINIVDTSPGPGTDEYALVWDNDTARFVLRAPFDGTPYALLAGRAGGQTLYGGTAANDDITIHGTSDATRTTSYVLLQPSGGNVGIGTTSPGYTLDVQGAAPGNWVSSRIQNTSDGAASLIFGASNTPTPNNWSININAVAQGDFNIASGINAGGTSRLYINASGNVGIGTVSPATALHVVGAATITGGIRPAADSTTALQLQTAAGASVLNVDTTNGNVGIGTTAPVSKLDISDPSNAHLPVVSIRNTSVNGYSPQLNFDTYAYGGSPAGMFSVLNILSGYSGAVVGGYVTFNVKSQSQSTAVEALRLKGTGDVLIAPTAGNVGIRDVAPAEALDVTGNINTTGVVKVDDVQVLSNRVIDARCADVANSGDATTDGLIDALRDAMIAHGLIAAA